MSTNIYTTTSTIINKPKLIEELEELPLSGDFFDFFISKGENFSIYYTQNLDQAQVDEIANHINNFVEVSVLDETTQSLSVAQLEGWLIYKKIIADINISGGLGTIDGGMAAYSGITPIRNMLKDGFSEYSLRYIATVIEPAGMFPQEQVDKYKLWIREHAKKHNGTPDFVLDLIEDASNPI